MAGYPGIGQALARNGNQGTGGVNRRGPGLYPDEQAQYDLTGLVPEGFDVSNGALYKRDWLDKWGKYLIAGAPLGLIGASALVPAISGMSLGGASGALGATAGGTGAAAGTAATGGTAAAAGAAGAKGMSSWLPSAITAGAGTANALMNRHSANDQQQQILQALMPFLQYQKYLLAMSDPNAAGYLGIPTPQGAQPIRQAVNQSIYQMLPVFARQGLGQ